MAATYKTPHSTFKEKAHPLNPGVGKCPCGQTFDYASERDWDTKFRLHSKVCPKLAKGSKLVRIPKKVMTLKDNRATKLNG